MWGRLNKVQLAKPHPPTTPTLGKSPRPPTTLRSPLQSVWSDLTEVVFWVPSNLPPHEGCWSRHSECTWSPQSRPLLLYQLHGILRDDRRMQGFLSDIRMCWGEKQGLNKYREIRVKMFEGERWGESILLNIWDGEKLKVKDRERLVLTSPEDKRRTPSTFLQ